MFSIFICNFWYFYYATNIQEQNDLEISGEIDDALLNMMGIVY